MAEHVDLWTFYKKRIKHSEPLDAFWKDAVQQRECIRYTYGILNTEKPAVGAAHDWNASRTAMSMHMDEFEKAFWKFYKKPTEKNAQKFSDAFDEMYPAYRMAKDAMFNSKLTAHWNEVQDDVVKEVQDEAEKRHV